MQNKSVKINAFTKKTVFSVKQKAFTLLEVIISVLIFALIMLVSVSVFVSVFHARVMARNNQKSLEDARTAMETIAKNIRMSTVVASPSSNEIYMFNKSQSKCIGYEVVSGVLMSVSYGTSDALGDPTYPTCPLPVFSGPNSGVMISSGIGVNFNFLPTITTPGSQQVGRTTIMMTVTTGTITSNLQTTVSFRDYRDILYN